MQGGDVWSPRLAVLAPHPNPNAPNLRLFQSPETSHSSSQRKLGSSDFCAKKHWMIRFAHPFGAILRMFSALRATSSFRWNDGCWNSGGGCPQVRSIGAGRGEAISRRIPAMRQARTTPPRRSPASRGGSRHSHSRDSAGRAAYAVRLTFTATTPASCMFQPMHRPACAKRDASHAGATLDMTIPPALMHVDCALHISLTHIEILLISFDSNATYSRDKP